MFNSIQAATITGAQSVTIAATLEGPISSTTSRIPSLTCSASLMAPGRERIQIHYEELFGLVIWDHYNHSTIIDD